MEVCKVEFSKLSSVIVKTAFLLAWLSLLISIIFYVFLKFTNYPGHYVLVRFAIRKATHTLSFY